MRLPLVAALIATATTLMPNAVPAQEFPSKPVTIIVPFTAAGPTDKLGRLLAKAMSTKLGQEVRIENIAGDGGSKGAAAAAKASPDGYVLLLHHFGLAAARAFYPNLPFNAERDFQPIGLISQGPYILSVRSGLRINSMPEALKYIRDRKGKATFGHAGIGSGSHLCNLLFKSAYKVEFEEKTYRGTGPAMNDLAVGQIDFLFDQTVSALKFVKEGTITALAVTGARRLKETPELPTLQEAGAKGYEVTQWTALYAPGKTPKEVIAKLAAALESALVQPEVLASFAEFGTEAFPATARGPSQTATKLRREAALWQRIVAESQKPAPAAATKKK